MIASVQRYEWRQGAPSFGGVDPNDVGAELEKLRIANEGVRPQEVVDAARNGQSPLHPAFEWDDTVAAEAHRRATARLLCRSIKVVVVRNEVEMREPMLVNVAVPSKPGEETSERYYQAPRVLNEDMWEAVLAAEDRRLEQCQRTVLELEAMRDWHADRKREIGNVSRAIKQTREAIQEAVKA